MVTKRLCLRQRRHVDEMVTSALEMLADVLTLRDGDDAHAATSPVLILGNGAQQEGEIVLQTDPTPAPGAPRTRRQ